MSVRLTVKSINVSVEGDDPKVLAEMAGQLLGSVFGGIVALPAAVVPPALPASKPRLTRKALATAATEDRDAAILKALAFRPLRVAELADALCTDKRDVKKAIPRLYSKLGRLVRDGKVKKVGKTYAVKG